MTPFSRPASTWMRWALSFVASWLVVIVATVAAAQGEGSGDETADGSGISANEIGDALPFSLDLRVDTSAAQQTRFFAREPLGFDGATFTALASDGSHWLTDAAYAVTRVFNSTPSTIVTAVAPWVAVVLLALLGWLVDRHAKRLFRQFAANLTPRSSVSNRVFALRQAVVQNAGKLVAPVLAWMLSYVPIQGLFESAPWTVALSQLLAFLVIYRTISAAASVFFISDIFDFPDESAIALRRIVTTSTAAILIFAALNAVIGILDYRSDVYALSNRLLRLSITLLSVRVLIAARHITRLLPKEGAPRYRQFRALFVRYLRHFVVYSLILLVLWTLGFTRAATTILLRSYGILALLVAGALALRWFDRYSTREHDNPLVAGLIAQVDSFGRFCINAAFGAAILGLLGLFNPLVTTLGSIGVQVGDSFLSLLGVLRAVGVVMIAVLLSRIVRVVLEHLVYPALDVDVGGAYATNTAVHYFLIAASLGGALIALGIDLSALTVFAGALGVGIGFGLQDFAKNMVSGFVLLFGKILRKGDLVTVGGEYTGHVEEISGRMIRVRTRDNTDLLIPASEVVGGALVNWTHSSPNVRIRVPVGASYDADPREVREALLDAAARFDIALRDPAPDVWFTEFGDNSINFELLIWVSATQIDPNAARGKILFHVWDAMAERNLEIPFPQRDLHLRSMDDTVAARLVEAMRGDAKTSEGDDTEAPSPSP